jgi:hypothetical protein
MAGDKRIERRAAGVQKVIATDGNGGREVSYSFNVEKAKVWVGFVGACVALIIAVIGAVWAGVQFGIGAEVHDEVQHECRPGGIIDNHVQQVAIEAVEEFQGVIQDDLDVYDRRLKDIEQMGQDLKTGQATAVQQIQSLSDQQQRNADELKMLIERAIQNGGG